jgi:hypothetical protein
VVDQGGNLTSIDARDQLDGMISKLLEKNKKVAAEGN